MAYAVVFEAGVLVLAIVLGWLVSVDPFAGLAFRLDHLGVGLAATVPPVIALWLLLKSTTPAVLEFRRVDQLERHARNDRYDITDNDFFTR